MRRSVTFVGFLSYLQGFCWRALARNYPRLRLDAQTITCFPLSAREKNSSHQPLVEVASLITYCMNCHGASHESQDFARATRRDEFEESSSPTLKVRS
jgi:cytochrome c553